MHDYNSDGYIDRDEAFTLYENDPISDEQIEQELDGVRHGPRTARWPAVHSAFWLPQPHAALSPLHCQTFGVMDVDKDGKMSYKEFSRFFERAIRNKPLHPELTGG